MLVQLILNVLLLVADLILQLGLAVLELVHQEQQLVLGLASVVMLTIIQHLSSKLPALHLIFAIKIMELVSQMSWQEG